MITTATVTTITAPRPPVLRDTMVALLTWALAVLEVPAARVDLLQALMVTHLQALAALAVWVWVLVLTADPMAGLEVPMEDHPVASEGIMKDTTEDPMVVLTEVQVAQEAPADLTAALVARDQTTGKRV